MALGPCRGPCPDLRSVGLRGSRPRTKGEPAEQSPPPPLGREGGGLRSPRMRARRTQAARKEGFFWRARRSEGALWWKRGSGWAGQVEPKDWLKLRTVTLLLEHLNREDGPVVAPSGRTAPKKENRSPPREGKGQGGDPREPPRPPSGGEGSKDSGHGGGGQGGGAGKPPLKGAPEKDYSYEYDEEDEEEEETSDDDPVELPNLTSLPACCPCPRQGTAVFHKTPRPAEVLDPTLQATSCVPQPAGMGHPQGQPGWRYEAPLRAHRVPQVRGGDGQSEHLQVLRRQGQDAVGCGTVAGVPPGTRKGQGAGGGGGPGWG